MLNGVCCIVGIRFEKIIYTRVHCIDVVILLYNKRIGTGPRILTSVGQKISYNLPRSGNVLQVLIIVSCDIFLQICRFVQ